MLRLKLLSRFIIIWALIIVAFTFFSVYQDLSENKLLNYNDTYASSDVIVKSEYTSNTILKYTFTFTPHDNYLGSVLLHYFRLNGNPGQVVFRIKKLGQNNWYAENRYDFSYFNNDDFYYSGFPEIADSYNKKYILEFEISSPNLPDKKDILNLQAVPMLTAKYVFPHNTYYRSPGKLAKIVFHRSSSTISKIDKVRVGIISFVISFLLFLAIYRQSSDIKPRIQIQPEVLQKNALAFGYWTGKINLFVIPGVILIILSLAFISGNFSLAEHMAIYLWITLLGSVIFYILQITVFNRLTGIEKFIHLISVNTVSLLNDLISGRKLVLLGILFVIISGLSPIYHLGGDDTRIFYIYPQQYLHNYSSKIVSDTGLSQLTNLVPPSSLTAFMVVLTVLRKILPFFNLQTLLNSANIVGGFFAFYYLLAYLLKPSGKYERVVCVLAAFTYVFSIFNFYTLLNSRLMAEYLISLFPLTLLMGIKAVREGKFYLLVGTVVIWSAFNLVSVSFPISGAVLITALPLLVFTAWSQKKRLILYLLSAGILFGILNLHWLTFIPYTNFSKSLPGSNSASLTSAEFRKQNESGIRSVSEINSSFFPLLNSYHQQIQLDFHWPQLPIYLSWYSKFLPLGFIFTAIILLAGIRAGKNKPLTKIFVAAVFSFGLAIYFFTVDIGPWGVPIFIWLTDHIPGFVIFRNMFDKFAFSLAFEWGLVLAVSLIILIKSFRRDVWKVYLLFLVFVIAIINTKPYLLGEFSNLPYWTTHYSYDGIRAFNSDYQHLVDYIKNQNTTGRYLSLPLLTGNSVIVQDQYDENHYYAGVSPLLLLTDKNDLSGLISFADKSTQVYDWLKNKDYTSFGNLARKYNTKYVIVSHQTSPDLQNSFMFSEGLFNFQTPDFINSIIGHKIKDFGKRYSLYEIAPAYQNEKIYLSDNPEDFSVDLQSLSFTKKFSHEYQITVSHLNRLESLVFLDPYLPGWQLRTTSGKLLADDNHYLVFGYANAWPLDPQSIKANLPASDYQVNPDGSLNISLRLYFQPYDYYRPTLIISFIGYILSLLFIIISIFKSKKV